MIDQREAFLWKARQMRPIMGVVEHIGYTDSFTDLLESVKISDKNSSHFVIGHDTGQWALAIGSGPMVLHPDVKVPIEDEYLGRAAVHIPQQTFPNLNPVPDVDPNRWTIAKVHVGYPGEPWSDGMIANDRACNEFIIQKVGRRAFTHIMAHSDFDNNVVCPGPSFPWGWLYRKARFIDTDEVEIMRAIPKAELQLLATGDEEGYNNLYRQHGGRLLGRPPRRLQAS